MDTFDADIGMVEEDNHRDDYGDDSEELNLGLSLKERQDYPIILRPHTNPGWFILVDGHRRYRAARRAGIKTLKAVLVEKGLTKAEIRLIQLRTDIFKKKLGPFELAMLLIPLADEHSGTVKQLAALVHMEESLLWKYLQAKKLSPSSLEAFRSGSIGLKDVVELAKLSHEEQPVLLNLRLGGASTEEVRKARKRTSSSPSAARASRIKIELGSDLIVTISGAELTLDEAIEAVVSAQKEMRKGRDLGLDAKTIVSVARDKARNGS
jgi:ParB family transcriptional regulator, chromosome partitioning protein